MKTNADNTKNSVMEGLTSLDNIYREEPLTLKDYSRMLHIKKKLWEKSIRDVVDRLRSLLRGKITEVHVLPDGMLLCLDDGRVYYNDDKDFFSPTYNLLRKGYDNVACEELVVRCNLLDSNVIDIGANYGYYSVLFSKQVGKKGHVYAFEPNQEILPYLHKNLKLNHVDNVKIFPVAVSDRKGNEKLYYYSERKACSSLRNISKTESIIQDCVTLSLDEFVSENKINNVSCIKLDAEGAEFRCLIGASQLISSQRPFLFIEICNYHLEQFNDNADMVFKFLIDYNYCIYEQEHGEIIDISQWRKLGKIFDIFCCPREKYRRGIFYAKDTNKHDMYNV